MRETFQIRYGNMKRLHIRFLILRFLDSYKWHRTMPGLLCWSSQERIQYPWLYLRRYSSRSQTSANETSTRWPSRWLWPVRGTLPWPISFKVVQWDSQVLHLSSPEWIRDRHRWRPDWRNLHPSYRSLTWSIWVRVWQFCKSSFGTVQSESFAT